MNPLERAILARARLRTSTRRLERFLRRRAAIVGLLGRAAALVAS